MSLKLNVHEITRHTFYSIPVDQIEYLSQNFPITYLQNFLVYLGKELESPQHIEGKIKN